MTALSSGLRRPGLTVYLALIVLAAQSTHSAPIDNDSTQVAEYDGAGGCYYNFQHYQEGARIVTNEPCLNCTCHNRMLMCYLRVCPFSKSIGQDCTVEKRPDQCCPVITCPEVPVQLLTSTTTSPAIKSPAGAAGAGGTELGFPDTYGCSVNQRFYADGAQLPINSSNPCELCYCIRNKTTCLMQQCTLSVAGCKPVYQPGICCPVRYNCDYDERDVTTPGLIMTTSTTTVAPLRPTSPPQCTHDGKLYDDGELIYTIQPCQHCYCFHGDIVCAVQECGKPMESHGKNCTALQPLDGECCPSYQCEDGSANVATDMPDVTDINEVPQEPPKESFPGDDNVIPKEVAADHSTPTTEEPQTVSPIRGEVPEPGPSESPAAGEEFTTAKVEEEMKPIESEEPHDDGVTEKAPLPDETVIQNTTPMPAEGEKETEAAPPSEFPPRIEGDEHGDEAATTESNSVAEASTESKVPQTGAESTTPGAERGVETASEEPEVTTETKLEPEQPTTLSPESGESTSSGQADVTTEKATTVSEGVDKTSESSSPVSEVIVTEQNISKDSIETTPLPSEVESKKPSEPAPETTEQTTTEPGSDKSEKPDLSIEPVVSEEDKSTTLRPDVDSSSPSSSPSSEADKQPESEEPVTTPETSTPAEPSKEDEVTIEPGSETTLSSETERESDKSESPVSPDATTAEIPDESVTSAPEATTTKPSDETVSEEAIEPASPETPTPEDIENRIPEEIDTTTPADDSSKPKETIAVEPEVTTTKNIEQDNEGAETRVPFETSTLPAIGSKKPEPEDETPPTVKPIITPIESEQPKTEETPSESITTQAPEEPIPEVSEEPVIPEKGPSGIPSVSKPERGPVNKKVDSNETLAEPEVTEGPLVTGSGMPHTVDNLQTEEPEYGSTTYLPPVGSSTEADRQPSTPVYEEPPKDDFDAEKETTELSITPKITYDTTTVKQAEDSSPATSEEEKPSGEDETTFKTPDEVTTKHTDVSSSTEEVVSETSDESMPEKEGEAEQTSGVPDEESTTVPGVKESEPSISDEGKTSTEASEEEKDVSKSPEVDEGITTNAPGIDQTSVKSESEETSSEPVSVGGVSSEAPELVTESQNTSSEADILPSSTESQQKSEGTEPATEIPIAVEPEIPGSTSTEKTSEIPVEPVEADTNTTASPEEDKVTTPKSEKPTESSTEVETPESTAAPAFSESPTESSKESSTEPGEQSKQVPESVSTTVASGEVSSEQESAVEPTTEKSATPEEVSVKIEESSQSTESNEITSQTPIVEVEVTRPTSGIPGEGNCLVDGQSYTNNSAVPPSNACQLSCRCISSLVNCELVKCLPPPHDLPPNCTPIYSGDSCCPMYICDSTPKVELEAGNQMSDSHTTPAYDENKTKTSTNLPEQISTEEPKIEEPTEPAIKVQSNKESTTLVPTVEEETSSSPESTESSEEDHPAIDVRDKEDEEKEPTLPVEPSKGEEETSTAIVEPLETTSQKSVGEEEEEEKEAIPVVTEVPTPQKSDSEPEAQTEKQDFESVSEPSRVEGSSEPTGPLEASPLPGESEVPVSEPETTVEPSEGVTKTIVSGSTEEPTSLDVTEATSSSTTTPSEKKPVEEETQKPEDLESEKQTSEPTVTSPITSSETPLQESTETSTADPAKESAEDSTSKSTSESSPPPEADITTTSPEGSSSPIALVTEEDTSKQQESSTEGITSEPSEGTPKETLESEPSTSAPSVGDESTPVSTEPKPSEEPLQTTVQPEVESPAETSPTMLPVDEATKEPLVPEKTSSTEAQPEETSEPSKSSSDSSEQTNIESTEVPQEPSKEEAITTAVPSDESGVKMVSSESPIESERETESPVGGSDETNIETKLESSTEPSEVPQDKQEEATTSIPKTEEPSVTTPVAEQPSTDDQAQERPVETPVEAPIETSTEGEEIVSSAAPGVDEETTKGEPQVSSEEPPLTVEPVKSEDEQSPETPSVEEGSTEKSSSEAAIEPSSPEPTISEVTTSEPSLGERLGDNEPSTPSAISEEPAVSHAESTSEMSASSTPEIQEQSTKESAQEPSSTELSEASSPDDEQQIHGTQAHHTEEPIAQEPVSVPEQSTEHSEPVIPHKRPEYPDQPENVPETDDETIFPPEGGNIKDPFETPESEGEDYDGTDEHIYGPGTCRYGGKIYMSAQQIPRDDPCDFCFCFRSDIICLQQSCPPPIPGCHEEPISGFCCPRYECPVSMATSLNVTTTTTTTTTTVPPHFLSHAYRGNASRGGCQIGNRAYRVGEEIKSKSGPCMGCTCGGDGKMKCEPKACSASPLLKEMIAHAAAKRRRR